MKVFLIFCIFGLVIGIIWGLFGLPALVKLF